jgi:uncharacterized membrane protein YbaN (DUF454 family)
MALDFAKGLCQPQARYDDGWPILSPTSTPDGSGPVSFNAIFQQATVHSATTIANDAPGTAFPVITPVAVASPGPDRGAAEGGPNASGRWIRFCEQAGVIEICDPRLFRPGRESFCRALVESAVALFGASRAEVRMESSMCRLEFEPGRFDRTELARRVAEAVRAATPAVRDKSGRREDTGAGWTILTAFATDGGTSMSAAWEESPNAPAFAERLVVAPTGSGRLTDLALAGGAFVLAVGGVFIPGIPTLPFLIMAGRSAVRVSPGIERLLMRQPCCAALLARAETRSGSTLDWRSLSRTIALAALFASGFLILHPPLPVVLGLELGLMAFSTGIALI